MADVIITCTEKLIMQSPTRSPIPGHLGAMNVQSQLTHLDPATPRANLLTLTRLSWQRYTTVAAAAIPPLLDDTESGVASSVCNYAAPASVRNTASCCYADQLAT